MSSSRIALLNTINKIEDDALATNQSIVFGTRTITKKFSKLDTSIHIKKAEYLGDDLLESKLILANSATSILGEKDKNIAKKSLKLKKEKISGKSKVLGSTVSTSCSGKLKFGSERRKKLAIKREDFFMSSLENLSDERFNRDQQNDKDLEKKESLN